jgi:hypothetical protein
MEEDTQVDESVVPRNGVGQREPLSPSESLEAGDEPGSLLPSLPGDAEAAGWQLALPASGELERMLSEREDGNSLVDLEKAAASLLDLAKRQDLAKQQLFELAEWHLRVKRKLGGVLLQVDGRGGSRAKAQAALLLDRSAARRLRHLARIAVSDWDAYLVRARSVGRIPSGEGALRFAKPKSHSAVPKRMKSTKSNSGAWGVEVSSQVLDAIERCLGNIDVCVGSAKVSCSKRVVGAKLTATDIQGTVLVAARVDAEVWLNKFVELKRSAQCEQLVILLRAETSASWFRHFSCARWHLCFLAESYEPTLVAYIGKRSEAFFAAMHEHGVVLGSHQ